MRPTLRWRTGIAYDRSNDPVGVARQLVAIAASGDRTAALRSLSVPTLVVHGADDPLVECQRRPCRRRRRSPEPS